jgi:pentatricopeptide repeat protein
VLKCCYQSRQWSALRSTYGEMVGEGVTLPPGKYRPLMEAVCRGGQLGLAVEVLSDMATSNMQPDAPTVTAFVSALYARGQYEEAWSQLERHGVRAPAGSYGAMVQECTRREDWDEVLRLAERMGREGLESTRPVLLGTMRALAETGQWDAVDRCVDDMVRSTLPCTLNLCPGMHVLYIIMPIGLHLVCIRQNRWRPVAHAGSTVAAGEVGPSHDDLGVRHAAACVCPEHRPGACFGAAGGHAGKGPGARCRVLQCRHGRVLPGRWVLSFMVCVTARREA